MSSATPETSYVNRLWPLARLFLKLGTLGFGGPQAHIAIANDEAVARYQWLTEEQFADGLAVCEMLPGPASTQMGIYIGYVWAGQLGALLAGLCFITPAFLIVLFLSWGYFHFQQLPQVSALFLGVSPVVTAIILAFCWKLGKKTIRDGSRITIAIVVLVITLLTPISVLMQFLAAGLVGLWLYRPPSPDDSASMKLPSILALPLMLGDLSPDLLTLSSVWGLERIQDFLWPLSLFFLRTGSFIFGGGLVIIPLLEFQVVDQLGWLTRPEFISGVAIGQLSPGPVVLTAAFVGYKVAGVLGALVATVAIFAPSFAFIMVASPLLIQIRGNPWIRAFLQGVTPAVLGAIAAAAIPLAQTALVQANWIYSLATTIIGLGALIALLRFETPTWQLIPLGAGLGFLASLVT